MPAQGSKGFPPKLAPASHARATHVHERGGGNPFSCVHRRPRGVAMNNAIYSDQMSLISLSDEKAMTCYPCGAQVRFNPRLTHTPQVALLLGYPAASLTAFFRINLATY